MLEQPESLREFNPRSAVGHVLFLDIVAFTLLSEPQKVRVLEELHEVVQGTEACREAGLRGEVVKMPRGDGMAIVFFGDLFYAPRCAMEIARELKWRDYIRVRMGIHSDQVQFVRDVEERLAVTGGGVVTAHRVMECGDAGHILLSESFAQALLFL